MTLEDVKAVVLACDPDAKHYGTTARGNYTTWQEYQRSSFTRDDVHAGGWKFQIDRFTKMENDPIVSRIEAMLSSAPNVAYSYLVDFEAETGYIHHIYDCEAV